MTKACVTAWMHSAPKFQAFSATGNTGSQTLSVSEAARDLFQKEEELNEAVFMAGDPYEPAFVRSLEALVQIAGEQVKTALGELEKRVPQNRLAVLTKRASEYDGDQSLKPTKFVAARGYVVPQLSFVFTKVR